MPVYTNLEVMLRDIISYMRMMPGIPIRAADDSETRMFGYCVVSDIVLRWEIPMEILRGQASYDLMQTVMTSEGRTTLVSRLREMSRAHTTSLEEVAQWRDSGRSIGVIEDERVSIIASLGNRSIADAEDPVNPEIVWDWIMKV